MSEALCQRLRRDHRSTCSRSRRRSPAPGRTGPTGPTVRGNGRLMIVAADHPARGALGVGARPTAMNSRTDLLDRLRAALADPGVDGVLATADILDDLLLLGALEDKVVFSSMNRGGLAGAQFELDDRMTAATAASTAAARMNGGKMLCRIDLDDPGTVCDAGRLRTGGRRTGRTRADRDARAVHVDAGRRQGPQRPEPRRGDQVDAHRPGLGSTSAYTWMKLPGRRRDGPRDGVDDAADPAARRRPRRPRRGVRQLGEGARSAVGARADRRTHPALPADDDVSSAVATAVSMVR